MNTPRFWKQHAAGRAGRQGKSMMAPVLVVALVAVVVVWLWLKQTDTQDESPPATLADSAVPGAIVPVDDPQDQVSAAPAGIDEPAPADRSARDDVRLVEDESQQTTGEETPTFADYQRPEFEHVPSWIPLPPTAVAASAEDASLRSDGFVEGTLHFDFLEGTDEVVGSLVAAFQSEGMTQVEGGTAFAMSQPPRNVEVTVAETDSGLSRVTVQYSGIDHEKGCTCVTCGGPGLPDGDLGHEP